VEIFSEAGHPALLLLMRMAGVDVADLHGMHAQRERKEACEAHGEQ
jgi:hypothetical protein